MEEKNMNMEDKKENGEKRNSRLHRIVAATVIVSVLVSASVGALFGFLAGSIGKKGVLKTIEKVLIPKKEEEKKNGNQVQKEKLSVVEEDSAVISVVEKSSPSVVSVIITKDVPVLGNDFFNPFFNDPFFNPFGFGQEGQGQSPQTERREIGGGTGFIASQDGYIITNRHVAEDDAAEYTVITNDGRKIPAKVVAKDQYNDIAVLKVEETNLPILSLGDSEALKIGQTVIAIGNSLGEFRNTVSKGIISGLKRNISATGGVGASEQLSEVIQTDAAINPGNSGGPLLNLRGEVIGINVAMAQGAENIGFSIPSDQIKEILQSVKDTGRIVRPYLGVRYAIVDDQIQKENNLPYNYGALVLRGDKRSDLAVIPGSPADKAGIVENDLVLEIDKRKVDGDNDLSVIIRSKKPGDEVVLKVWSKGQEKEVRVKLEESK